MCKSTHNSRVNLKLVMLFDSRNETYCICSHNLTDEEASQESDELRRDGLPAFTVNQRSRHTAEDAEVCPACRTEVAHSIKSSPVIERRNRGDLKRQR
jgi:hypothetical protein